jgi:large subunit ribosomal protein L9
MKVIFLQDVARVGKRHDIKEINDGYAMNFLFPRKLAEPATPKAVADLETRKKNIEIEREVQTDLLLRNLQEIKGKVLHMKGRADETGHLFSGIRPRDIVDAMKAEHKADIAEGAIKLDRPIKEVGEYEIPIEMQGKHSYFNLMVEGI